MQSPKPLIAAMLVVVVTFTLCGAPALVQAQQAPAPSPPAAQNPGTSAPEIPEVDTPASHNQVPSPTGTDVDPSKGPLQPLPPSSESQQQLPNAPAAQPTGTPQAPAVPMANAPAQQKPPSEPIGTATAERTPTAGGAASEPAGTAIAPAKQRQVRSLIIKLGALGGAAIALGTVMALSRSTPSVPPGAKSITRR